ncbi:hypothetical protein [Flavobacterium phage V157]|uniref:Uncharacterized protein n=20 Tax=Ficleduovirus TaxID=2560131 RepID=A0A0A0YPK0_9CAUD|nr:hypothetical protein ABG42_gp70 [Flavobacterium phage FCL-2]YP_009591158.1 hypothetical protein FDG55_gp72 [Flavobacterium phage FCV-1]ASD51654.1 hypothetical protein [Flavobacterium phage FCV-3]ASD51728.1 hypothetical protein [Flavobacterium phage FCV-11]ASD51805.1 hypothetical protein [Flavobacterium phage V175]ASD51882.1 hypothetical protein [Flavobacterium phage V181]ASD52557.1 hypothetical protein [Flavobacterium phage FCV-10]ASD52631.1 hypothetical protein [Flavobacterium phage FCV-
MKKTETHNGLELLLTSQLVLELFENYKITGIEKRYGNMFVDALAKKTETHYNQVYRQDPEFTTNSLKLKERLIKQIAEFNEADVILFSDFTKKYIDNIEIARQKGVVFFDKLLNS